jgi:hypothetical protein
VLRNAILEVKPHSNNDWRTKKLFLDELMLNKELETIEQISWRTPRAEYNLEFQQANMLNTMKFNPPIQSVSLQQQSCSSSSEVFVSIKHQEFSHSK